MPAFVVTLATMAKLPAADVINFTMFAELVRAVLAKVLDDAVEMGELAGFLVADGGQGRCGSVLQTGQMGALGSSGRDSRPRRPAGQDALGVSNSSRLFPPPLLLLGLPPGLRLCAVAAVLRPDGTRDCRHPAGCRRLVRYARCARCGRFARLAVRRGAAAAVGRTAGNAGGSAGFAGFAAGAAETGGFGDSGGAAVAAAALRKHPRGLRFRGRDPEIRNRLRVLRRPIRLPRFFVIMRLSCEEPFLFMFCMTCS